MEELPTLEQESPGMVPAQGNMPRDSQGEEVVIHMAEEEIGQLLSGRKCSLALAIQNLVETDTVA